MRTVLRAILMLALLLGGGLGDWTAEPLGSAAALTHESCCCGEPTGMEDACPCPKPEGNRGPSQNACSERTAVVAAPATRRTQAQRRVEARPEPATWATFNAEGETPVVGSSLRGRAPDLGRHLAGLSTFRI
ncbi:hypothetical protein [Geothrix sp. PMB-07]|uniref:hypothetical protein n=1 Tax=Geothrix sp. PMB-07 TaxID=3068640 RepID=UPI002741FCAC|nr:hypothetical protein [Geothrix sp. PMB-07]WLT30511.1 hypothetical protein Q9293_12370 [Geothrix sp. PMB-07]